MGLGMFITMQAYQVYICSTLQFIAQLEPLPEESQHKERGVTQSLFPGHTAWMRPQCLKDANCLHLPGQLMDMQAVAQAAKVRVCRFENIQHGGLHVEARARMLLSNFDNACSLAHVGWCIGWGQNNLLFLLSKARESFKTKLREGLGGTVSINKKVGLQKIITPWFKSVGSGMSMRHLRRRSGGFQNMSTLLNLATDPTGRRRYSKS